jgi:hypothetical protein
MMDHGHIKAHSSFIKVKSPICGNFYSIFWGTKNMPQSTSNGWIHTKVRPSKHTLGFRVIQWIKEFLNWSTQKPYVPSPSLKYSINGLFMLYSGVKAMGFTQK